MKLHFQKYCSDGPGYRGAVEIDVDGDRLACRLDGAPDQVVFLPLVVPEIIGAAQATEEDLPVIWSILNAGSRDYLMDMSFIDLSRVKVLAFANGKRGFLLLYGEPNFIGISINEQEEVVLDVDLLPPARPPSDS